MQNTISYHKHGAKHRRVMVDFSSFDRRKQRLRKDLYRFYLQRQSLLIQRQRTTIDSDELYNNGEL